MLSIQILYISFFEYFFADLYTDKYTTLWVNLTLKSKKSTLHVKKSNQRLKDHNGVQSFISAPERKIGLEQIK